MEGLEDNGHFPKWVSTKWLCTLFRKGRKRSPRGIFPSEKNSTHQRHRGQPPETTSVSKGPGRAIEVKARGRVSWHFRHLTGFIASGIHWAHMDTIQGIKRAVESHGETKVRYHCYRTFPNSPPAAPFCGDRTKAGLRGEGGRPPLPPTPIQAAARRCRKITFYDALPWLA